MDEKLSESVDWRLYQKQCLHDALKRCLKGPRSRIDDIFEVEIKDVYFPNIGEGYHVHGNVKSHKVGSYGVIWWPIKKEFQRWAVYIQPKHRGEGIGSSLNEITERVARDLDCEKLIMKGIVDTSLEHWKNREDFIVRGNRATKILR